MNRTASFKSALKIAGGALFRRSFSLHPKHTRFILAYHHVFENVPSGIHDPAMYVLARTLDMHLEELGRYFKIVPLDHLLDGTTAAGKGACAITFDDGFSDFFHVAYPILKERSVPATVFLTSSVVEGQNRFWFDDLFMLADLALRNSAERSFAEYFRRHAPSWQPAATDDGVNVCRLGEQLKGLRGDVQGGIVERAFVHLGFARPLNRTAIDWRQAEEMGKEGISFGSHGRSHVLLTRLETEEKRKNIRESMRVLRSKAIPTTAVYSYANGDWDRECVELLRQEGYAGAVTMTLGCLAQGHRYTLPRVPMHEYISRSPALFWFRILQAWLSKAGQEN